LATTVAEFVHPVAIVLFDRRLLAAPRRSIPVDLMHGTFTGVQ
jgi:hypothetical protein